MVTEVKYVQCFLFLTVLFKIINFYHFSKIQSINQSFSTKITKIIISISEVLKLQFVNKKKIPIFVQCKIYDGWSKMVFEKDCIELDHCKGSIFVGHVSFCFFIITNSTLATT